MSLSTPAALARDPNPIAPYLWEARYERGRLRQHDVDGWHTSRDIDRQRIRALVIHGHPASPITIDLPEPPWPLGPAPDEILVQRTTDLSETVELGTPELPANEVRAWVFFGFRYGADRYVLQIDPAGHMMKTNVTAPVPCGRCGR